MSGDRYEIGMDELGCWVRQLNETWACVMHFTQDSESLQERIAEKVIRQQARDIDQLRADLAAAVAARDWQIQATKAAIESCNQATTAGLAAVAERDQLRARQAAIEAAPVVAIVWFSRDGNGRTCSGLDYAELPPVGTELIAKPAKD